MPMSKFQLIDLQTTCDLALKIRDSFFTKYEFFSKQQLKAAQAKFEPGQGLMVPYVNRGEVAYVLQHFPDLVTGKIIRLSGKSIQLDDLDAKNLASELNFLNALLCTDKPKINVPSVCYDWRYTGLDHFARPYFLIYALHAARNARHLTKCGRYAEKFLVSPDDIDHFLELFYDPDSAEQFIVSYHQSNTKIPTDLPTIGCRDRLQALELLTKIVPAVNFHLYYKQLLIANPDNLEYRLAGQNITALQNINGINIDAIEERMRPMSLSDSGFIAADESLLEVLNKDHEHLNKLNLSHNELATVLLAIIKLYDDTMKIVGDSLEDVVLMLGEQAIGIKIYRTRGPYQESPFGDAELPGNREVVVKDLSTGSTLLEFAEMLPYLIARYGFYEGSVHYRVEPQDIINTFECVFDRAPKLSSAPPEETQVAAPVCKMQ